LDLLHPTLYDDAFYDQQAAGSLASARILLTALFNLCPVTSVVDIGCGVGPWVRSAIDLGAVDSIGLDGDYVDRTKLLVAPDRFQACDLETENLRDAIPEGRLFDAVLCMEVAEHLSPDRAASFVAELCLLSDLVLFSAAVPGQGGTNHINEQWPDYWSRHFATAGFDCFDVLRAPLWHEADCEWWYLQNALVFARPDSAAWRRLAQSALPTPRPMPLVHPRKLAQLVSNEAGYTIMNTILEERLAQQAADHAAAVRTIGERQLAECEQLQADIALLNEDIARRKAEREATFEATRLWMLGIERERAADQAGAERQLASVRAALTTVQHQLATALASAQAQATAYRRHQGDYDQLQAKHHALSDMLAQNKDRLDLSAADVERLQAHVKALYASTSWRITAPIRALRRRRS
jgi:SAM-dependent methyltransferase